MQEVFVQEVCRVASDPVHWVRREASFAIGALAKVVPIEMVTAHLVSLVTSLMHGTDAVPAPFVRSPSQRRYLARAPFDPVRAARNPGQGECCTEASVDSPFIGQTLARSSGYSSIWTT